jgi:hypothetical protein
LSLPKLKGRKKSLVGRTLATSVIDGWIYFLYSLKQVQTLVPFILKIKG